MNEFEYSDFTCSTEAGTTMTASIPDTSQNHRRRVNVLRYRGMESEAVTVARLIKAGSLKATLQSVLNDIDASMEVWTNSAADTKHEASNCENDDLQYDAPGIARRHVQFVEEILTTSLTKIHAYNESASGHSD